MGPQATPLPAYLSSFIGRRADQKSVRALLSESRLVTLVGVGGVGKTRLALAVADELRRTFDGGVIFVGLAAQADPSLLATTVASAFGLQGRSKGTPGSSIVDHVQDRRVLLVLDNCEHMIDEAAQFTETLIGSCPGVRVLATSREPLRINGESVYVVEPLSVPPRDTQESLTAFEGITLFLERARAAVTGFELDATNRASVADIVRRLEGIPLAIELAAGRLRALSPNEIAINLREHWGLLSRGSRTASDRQRTMAACIEWSFDLCTAAEQEIWGKLSVFSDGFEIDAARAVTGSADLSIEDVVTALVDKSIVTASRHGAVTRYRMLPPIRHRGIAYLDDHGQLENVRNRHRDWIVGLTRAVADDWVSAQQLDGLYRLRRELGNVTAAIRFCFETGSVEPALEAGCALLECGVNEGMFRQGRAWLDQLLPLCTQPTELRARSLRTAAYWAAMHGDVRDARRLADEGLAIARTHGGHTEALLIQQDGQVAIFEDDTERARMALDRAAEAFEEYGDRHELVHTHALAAVNHLFRHDAEAALESCRACLSITEPAGESWYRSYALWIKSLAAWALGDPGRALELQRESLRLRLQTGDRLGIGTSIEAFAWMQADQEPEVAARLLGGAQQNWDHIETSTASVKGLHDFHVRCVETVRELLGEDSYRAAFEAGRAAGYLRVVSEALGEALGEGSSAPEGALPPTRSAAIMAPAVLTRREQEVAQLVASGLTNKEVAEKLVVSTRTAESHVDHILTKLGFNSRTQIAAWHYENAESASNK